MALIQLSMIIRMTRNVLQDSTAPVLQIQETTPSGVSQAQFGNFSFTVQDASTVTYSCRVNASDTSGEPQQLRARQPGGPNLDVEVRLGMWMNCTSPFTLYWLQEGLYSSILWYISEAFTFCGCRDMLSCKHDLAMTCSDMRSGLDCKDACLCASKQCASLICQQFKLGTNMLSLSVPPVPSRSE